ncbi:MAG TPA: glycine cleavage system protein GcvH [Planctomycetota bacterium]|nr:glycine cleavage system protein GcvH [Planctomycetota bacterium]
MARPQDLKYAKSHEWVRVEGDTIRVGITDYAVEQLSDLAFVDLPEVGDRVTKGSAFGEIESTKTVAELISPVDGEVVETNTDVVDQLQLLQNAPFEDGWLVRIRPDDPSALAGLLDAAAYERHIEEEGH